MRLKLITPAAAEPVALDEFALHARIDDYQTELADLQSKLLAARQDIEADLGRALVTSVWELYLNDFPCSNHIEIPLGQLQAVASVKYTDSGAVQHTLDPSTYEVDVIRDPGQIVLAYGRVWPSGALKTVNAVCIRFTCGWATVADVPAGIKTAILLQASHLYRHRENVTMGNTATESKVLAEGVERFLGWYRIVRF